MRLGLIQSPMDSGLFFEDGLIKASHGKTTLEEILRVVNSEVNKQCSVLKQLIKLVQKFLER